MANQFKIMIVQEMTHIVFTTGKIIIQTNNVITLTQKPFAKMRTYKTRSPRD